MDKQIISSKEPEKIIEIPKITIEEKPLTKLDILKKLSSGTPLREALNDIVDANTGALILINNPQANSVFQGGFRVDCKFTAKRLSELAKMDGAIILSEDFKKILYANTLLVPDPSLPTEETGTRHQAAERAAQQVSTLVIAVSQRKKEITIYYGNSKYILQHTETLLRRATETLQILEKQREIFSELLTNLNILEITSLVSVADVSKLLQRIEMIKKIANVINEYIIELGKHGSIVRMRLRELTRGIEKEQELIIKDYIKRPKTKYFLSNLNFEELLDIDNLSSVLFKSSLEKEIKPSGYRILLKTSLPKTEIDNLVKHFQNINAILEAEDSEISQVTKYPESFKKEINHLREQIMVGKKI